MTSMAPEDPNPWSIKPLLPVMIPFILFMALVTWHVKSTERVPCSDRVLPWNKCTGGGGDYRPGVGRTPWD